VKNLQKYIDPKPVEKPLQAMVDADVLENMKKAAKSQKLKFKKAVEIALKMFIDQAG
jgi:hypothetical protein